MGEKKRRLAAAATLDAKVAAARELHDAGRSAEAERALREVLRADASRADAWIGLGALAREAGAGDAALQCFARAASAAPGDPDARVHYAAALQDREDFDQALAHWRAACELQPDSALLWESLGIAEQAAGNTAAAVTAYERAIALEPTPARRAKIATALSPIPASRAAIAAERTRMANVLDALLADPALADGAPGTASPAPAPTDPFAARLWTNFYLAYHGENDRDLQQKTAAVYRRICPSLDFTAAHCAGADARGRRPRIGLISTFFRNHSIARTSRGLFAKLARERFEISAIFVAPVADDAFSQAIRRDAEHTLVVPRDLAAARAAIAARELDVLFYQDLGMEPFTYFLAFARLAPVQCVSFGHPDTTGIPAIDWFISNDRYEPEGAQATYSERLGLLRGLGSLAYYYRPRLRADPKPRAAFGLPADRPLYLCPQNLFKLHPDMDDLFAGILRRDPRGVVALVDGRVRHWSRLLRERWLRAIPDVAARIVFVPRLREDDFLNLIATADVMLDTVHFNGMNTSLEAFAVGTPVVTLRGALQRGRHTQAMYRRMGLDDLVAADADDYVDRAVKLGTDAAHRQAVSARILECSGVLFEEAAVIAEFERFFAEVAPRGSP